MWTVWLSAVAGSLVVMEPEERDIGEMSGGELLGDVVRDKPLSVGQVRIEHMFEFMRKRASLHRAGGSRRMRA